ncbi:hypothetical protein [Bradyrhizobium sp. SZCCHNS2015]|uniref:hypothetical protein n=1 Tax=Bradyrhizobium sp. SZCCHNS2015 TaxID=3057305 RepID=UPI0028EBF190|nr:hypothetical protein [Bradyrhizobium sp. SZCCHNS2015]
MMTKKLLPEPYVQELKDGTYEVHIPLAGHSLAHKYPQVYHTSEEAEAWLKSSEGRQFVDKVRNRYAT